MENEENTNKLVEYYCSNCGSAIGPDDAVCKNCGAELGESTSENTSQENYQTVVLRTYNNEFIAELSKAKLEDAGIDCYLSGDDAGPMRPNLIFTQGINLIVFEKDAELAEEILKEEE
jgi:hypothetical protein